MSLLHPHVTNYPEHGPKLNNPIKPSKSLETQSPRAQLNRYETLKAFVKERFQRPI